MSNFSTTVTTKGLGAIAQASAGAALVFTKVQLGDGKLASGDNPVNMSALKNAVADVSISKVWRPQDSILTVRAEFSNKFVDSGFYYRELGVFAIDPDSGAEILFAYANAGDEAEYIPPSGSATVIEKVLNIDVIIGNAENVTAVIKPEIYATAEDLKEHINRKDNPHEVTTEQINAVNRAGDTMTGILRTPVVTGAPGAGDQLALTASEDDDERGAYVSLCKSHHDENPGGFTIAAYDKKDKTLSSLWGMIDGNLIWKRERRPADGSVEVIDHKHIVRSVNGTQAGSDGNIPQGVGMVPSAESKVLSIGASGTMYAAPWDGYFAFGSSASPGGAYAWCRVYETGIVSHNFTNAAGSLVICAGFVPVQKGQRVSLAYFNVVDVYAYFVRAKGAE